MHQYEVSTVWHGNRGEGTASYRAYERLYDTVSRGRPAIKGSSDPIFRGDPERWNPELLLVAALSQCHMLSYLHRCAIGGVVVVEYTDNATGLMVEDDDDGGRFEEVVLHPIVTVAEATMLDQAYQLHGEASKRCFIASSVNFPVRHEARIVAADSLVA